MKPVQDVTRIPIFPATSTPRLGLRPTLGTDIFERLAPNQSRRPLGVLASRLGVPMLHNGSTDKFMHGCLYISGVAMAVVPLGMLVGLSLFTINVLTLMLYFGYQTIARDSMQNQPLAVD